VSKKNGSKTIGSKKKKKKKKTAYLGKTPTILIHMTLNMSYYIYVEPSILMGMCISHCLSMQPTRLGIAKEENGKGSVQNLRNAENNLHVYIAPLPQAPRFPDRLPTLIA
jgi:hypothetical protein